MPVYVKIGHCGCFYEEKRLTRNLFSRLRSPCRETAPHRRPVQFIGAFIGDLNVKLGFEVHHQLNLIQRIETDFLRH